jgi:uncharacterized membrane protein
MMHRAEGRVARFEPIYQLLALAFLFVGNFPLTFAHHYQAVAAATTLTPVAWLSCAGLAASAAWMGWQLQHGSETSREAAILLAIVAGQFIGMPLVLVGALGVSIWFNLVLIAELLAFLYLSYRLREDGLFRLALYGFAAEILGRYFDTFWTLLPRSFSFLVGGIVLIAGGILMERKRKTLFRAHPEARP